MPARSAASVSTRSGCAAAFRKACWPLPMRRACAGAPISSAPTSSATSRSSGRAFRRRPAPALDDARAPAGRPAQRRGARPRAGRGRQDGRGLSRPARGPAARAPPAPWHGNVRKRLVKSPKVYVRDSGLVHALLGIVDREALLAHPVAGGSWEGLAIESLIAAAPSGTEAHFFRTAAGAEIDLLLKLVGHRKPWAIEIKRGLAPKLERGFHLACDTVRPERRRRLRRRRALPARRGRGGGVAHRAVRGALRA
jgi:hypothetical protein